MDYGNDIKLETNKSLDNQLVTWLDNAVAYMQLLFQKLKMWRRHARDNEHASQNNAVYFLSQNSFVFVPVI